MFNAISIFKMRNNQNLKCAMQCMESMLLIHKKLSWGLEKCGRKAPNIVKQLRLVLMCLCVIPGDSLAYHNEQKFSTFDRDSSESTSCALAAMGPFWHKKCYHANLNGVYTWGQDHQHGAVWRGFKEFKSLKSISMKTRPRVNQPQHHFHFDTNCVVHTQTKRH